MSENTNSGPTIRSPEKPSTYTRITRDPNTPVQFQGEAEPRKHSVFLSFEPPQFHGQSLDLKGRCVIELTADESKLTDYYYHSVFGRQIRFDMKDGFPLLTTKKTFWRGIVTELLWFLSGSSNIKPLLDVNNHIWDEWAWKHYAMWAKEKAPKKYMEQDEFIKKLTDLPADHPFVKRWGELITIYGRMWRRWPAKDGREIDQLGWVIEGLKKKPYRKSYVVSAWNPDFIYEMASKGQQSQVPPFCHTMYQFQVANDKLNLGLYQRSADVFLGVPFNIASYSLLLLMVSQVTGIPAGEFVHTFGDLHLYSNHFKVAKEQLKRKPFPFPQIELNKKIKNIDDFKVEDILLKDYKSHPSLLADIANIGGFEKDSKKKKMTERKTSRPLIVTTKQVTFKDLRLFVEEASLKALGLDNDPFKVPLEKKGEAVIYSAKSLVGKIPHWFSGGYPAIAIDTTERHTWYVGGTETELTEEEISDINTAREIAKGIIVPGQQLHTPHSLNFVAEFLAKNRVK